MVRFIGRIVSGIIIVVLAFFLALQTTVLYNIIPDTTYGKAEPVGEVDIQGAIMESEEIIQRINNLKQQDETEAILLDISSPGGGVAASQEIAEAVSNLSDSYPVIASIRQTGASGAYYIASSADTIVANPGSIVGSIGVVVQFVNAKGLSKKVGITYETVKSGEYKTVGAPTESLNKSERQMIDNVVADVYDQFVDHILLNREMLGRAELVNIADGRILSGRQAKEKKLVDITGSRKKALKIAAEYTDNGSRLPKINEDGKTNRLFPQSIANIVNNIQKPTSRSKNLEIMYMMQ